MKNFFTPKGRPLFFIWPSTSMVKVKVKPNSTNLGTRQLMSLPPHTETKKVPGPGLLRIFLLVGSFHAGKSSSCRKCQSDSTSSTEKLTQQIRAKRRRPKLRGGLYSTAALREEGLPWSSAIAEVHARSSRPAPFDKFF